jgi:hypothetical protein
MVIFEKSSFIRITILSPQRLLDRNAFALERVDDLSLRIESFVQHFVETQP